MKAEDILIKTLVQNPELYEEKVKFKIKPEEFEHPINQFILRIFETATETGIKVDRELLEYQAREKKNQKGLEYIKSIFEKNKTEISNIDFYIKKIKEATINKEIEKISEYLNKEKKNKTSKEIIRNLSERLENLTLETETEILNSNKLIQKKIENMEERRKKGKDAIIRTGFEELDKIFVAGLNKGDFTVIGARPSMGKTVFALNIMLNISGYIKEIQPKKVLFFSLEMSSEQLLDRIIAKTGKFPLNSVRSAELDDGANIEEIGQVLSKIEKYSFFVSDKINELSKIEEIIKEKAKKEKIEVVIIDYLQLINVSERYGYRNRVQEVSEITRKLKLLAKKTETHIIALAQLSREVEKRADKRPFMSDLKESGSIEQDADNIIFLYRSNYYATGETRNEYKNGEPVEIIVSKQRSGQTGTVHLLFKGDYQEFMNAETGTDEIPNEEFDF